MAGPGGLTRYRSQRRSSRGRSSSRGKRVESAAEDPEPFLEPVSSLAWLLCGVLLDDPEHRDGRPLISLLPVLIIGVIFGLAMDYQVFLVSRMHEEHAHGATPRDAIRDGFRQSARVVTAAPLIMVAVFSGFILPDDPITNSVGFAFATGILIDAFLVRMTLIPALMTLLGTPRLVAAPLARPPRAQPRHRRRGARA